MLKIPLFWFNQYTYQGQTYGYVYGGFNGPGVNDIQKFAFAGTFSCSTVAILSTEKWFIASQKSTTHGYASSGDTGAAMQLIERSDFATDSNMSSVGQLTVARYGAIGASSSTHGYVACGSTTSNVIERFPFSSDSTNATDVGDATVGRRLGCGFSSSASGYIAGGYTSSNSNVIDKWSFASATVNATDVGDLASATRTAGGASSRTDGYVIGGNPTTSIYQKFSLVTDGNSSNIGNLYRSGYGQAGVSQDTYAWSCGSSYTGYQPVERIQYSSDTTTEYIGLLSTGVYYGIGNAI